MALLWRVCWTLAVLSLWPLALGAYVATRSPGSEASVERALIPQPPPKEQPKRYTICGIAGSENCWEVVSTPIR
jgi:hypothetical protein